LDRTDGCSTRQVNGVPGAQRDGDHARWRRDA